LHAFFTVLAEHPNAEVVKIRGNQDSAEIELRVASFSDLEAIRAELSALPGISENLEGADSENDGVSARVKVQRSGS
jgi:general secretion pathway protein L